MLSLPPSGGTGNKIDPAKLFGEDRYDKIYQELLSDGRIEGENLTPDERKEGVKAYRKGKINFVKFVTRIDEVKTQISSQKLSATPLTPKLALSPAVEPISPKPEPEPEKESKEEDNGGEDNDIEDINTKLDALIDEIKKEEKSDKKSAEIKRRQDEKKKRKEKENRLEGFKKFIVNPLKKAFAPVQNFLSKFIDAMVKIVFAKAFIKLIDWFSDPDNRGKVDAIFRFIKDFWPAIAAGFLLVGAALTGFGILALGKIAAVAALLIGLTVGLAALAKALFGKGPGEEEKKTDKALKDDYDGNKDKMIADLEKEKDSIGFFDLSGRKREIDEQIDFLKTGKPTSYGFFGKNKQEPEKEPEKKPEKKPEKDVKTPKDKEPPTVKLNVGGVVPGPEVLKLNDGGVVPEEMSLLQRLNQNFGDLPFIGGVIKTALDYEDRINYRDADPRLREMMGLTKSKPKPRGLQFGNTTPIGTGKDGKTAPSLIEQGLNLQGLNLGGGFLGGLLGGNKKSKKDNRMASMGTDTVPAMLTPGESVLQVGARERMMSMVGIDPLSFNIGPNANKPKVTKGVTYAAGGGVVDEKKHPLLEKMNDANIKKASAPLGRCVTGSLDTMLRSGVPEPAATGNDVGNNPRGAISQLMQSPFNWKSMGGNKTDLDSPYGKVSPGVYTKSQYGSLVAGGKIPSGALVFQSRFDNWNGTSRNSSGYDMAIAQKGGKEHWNGQLMPKFVYGGNTKKVIVLTPDGKQGDGTSIQMSDTDIVSSGENDGGSPEGYVPPVPVITNTSASSKISTATELNSSNNNAQGSQSMVPIPVPINGSEQTSGPTFNNDVPAIISIDFNNRTLIGMKALYNMVD